MNTALLPYICRLRPIDNGGNEYFRCLAEDEGHALEQAKDANPGLVTDRVKLDELSKTQYILFSVSEDGYWSNRYGWVSSCNLATRFDAHEKCTVSMPMSAGNDATWLTRYEIQYLAAGEQLKRKRSSQTLLQ